MYNTFINKSTWIVLIACAQIGAFASTVDVAPGNNIQAIVNAHPAGTTYIFTPGVYRMQSITPQTGDTYTGQSGAILNGSELATRFFQKTVSGVTYWVTAGPSKPGTVIGGCLSTSPMCAYPEDFFINSQVLPRVASLSAVTSSTCYFDYSVAEIYFLMNPTGQAVEIGTTPAAFSGTATKVTIQGLTIEKYAVPAQSGAVSGSSWTIRNNVITLNHGVGIHMSGNDVIESNYVHHNGQQGISGGGNAILVENNEVAFNNTLGFNFQWEAGGIWFSESTNPVVQGNYVHDNQGLGIHFDYETYNWLAQANHTQNNYSAGIDNEVGYNGTARYNVVENDGVYPGKASPSMWWGCGIYIYASSYTTISNNTLINNSNGICALSIARDVGKGNRGAFQVENLLVTDNVIVQPTGSATGAVASGSYYMGVYTSAWNNHWTSNTYKLPSTTAGSYVWESGSSYGNVDAAQWKAAGNDLAGTWISATDTSFPSSTFTASEAVQTKVAAPVYSLPTITSTLLKTEPNGTSGTVTKVAGPILTSGAWWWNVTFSDGTLGWCLETDLEK